MPKWKAQDRTVCIRGTVVCGQAEDDAECGIIVDAHNADIDAMTAERDELQRRLDAVVASLRPRQIGWDRASMDSPEYNAWCLVVPLYEQALAIAEGRDNE